MKVQSFLHVLSSKAEDFAIMRYADKALNLDGVDLDEEHYVMWLSPPRAVIFYHNLKPGNTKK